MSGFRSDPSPTWRSLDGHHTSTLPVVLDGSVTLAWLFLDAAGPVRRRHRGQAPESETLVPRLWHLEVANVLLVGERRKRCSQADTTQWLSYLAGLPIVVDGSTEARAWSDTVGLARHHGLTAYDAAYLEIAIREGVPIATLLQCPCSRPLPKLPAFRSTSRRPAGCHGDQDLGSSRQVQPQASRSPSSPARLGHLPKRWLSLPQAAVGPFRGAGGVVAVLYLHVVG